MGSATISQDEVRNRIDELVARWREGAVDDVAAARRDGDVVAVVVHGLAAHAHSLAHGVRLIDDAGGEPSMVPLARQVIECAVTAMWVEKYGRRAALMVTYDDTHGRVETFKAFVKAGVPDEGEIARWQQSLDGLEPDKSPSSTKFWQRCEELDGMAGVYAMYRAFSAVSHAGGMVTDLYTTAVEATPQYPSGVAIAAEPDEWARDSVVGLTLTFLLFAAMA
jgi:hypothetical protein